MLLMPSAPYVAGSLHRGDDYLEIGVNQFRFAFLTKRGVKMALPRTGEMEIMSGITIEGRDDDELPEQLIAVAHFRGIDMAAMASEAFMSK